MRTPPRIPRLAAIVSVVLLAAGCPDPATLPTTDGGASDGDLSEPTSLRERFERGRLDTQRLPRVASAGLRVRVAGERTYVLGESRDEAGRARRRLSVRDGAGERFAVEEQAGERLTDFAVHPGGDVTFGVERLEAPRDAFDLVRLDKQGRVRTRQQLARPELPEGERDPRFPDAGFAMKGVSAGSVVRGVLPWLRLEARGEGLVIGLVSRAELRGGGTPSDGELVSAVMALDWEGTAWRARWARLVDGLHQPLQVAWLYDDFLWLDAATRLVVALDGEQVIVGRSLIDSRCRSLARRGETTDARCRQLLFQSSHRYQPFAWTRFDGDGRRLGTTIVAPPGLEDFVVFDMAARGGEVALAGTRVLLGPSGAPDYYFEPPGRTDTTALSPYDGYLAILDAATCSRRFRGPTRASWQRAPRTGTAGGAG